MRHTRDTLYSMLGLTTAPCAETFDKHAQKPVPVNQSLRLNSLFVLFAASLAWLTPAAWLHFPTLPTVLKYADAGDKDKIRPACCPSL